MFQKKAIRLILLILIIIFAFQFMPLITSNIEGGDCHTPNLEVIKILSNVQNHSAAFIQKYSKFNLQFSNTKIQGFFQSQVFYNNYLIQYFNRNGIILNFKDKIENIISHYFHGSKYKEYLLSI